MADKINAIVRLVTENTTTDDVTTRTSVSQPTNAKKMKSASIPKDLSNVWITRVPQITKKSSKGLAKRHAQ